jgi:Cys-tRNA synthase (O-phospho-L-seryl-tRNA:Cys-tRNA synthase)
LLVQFLDFVVAEPQTLEVREVAESEWVEYAYAVDLETKLAEFNKSGEGVRVGGCDFAFVEYELGELEQQRELSLQ